MANKTLNKRLNNCVDILLDFDLISFEMARNYKNRIKNGDETAYKEIQSMLEKLSDLYSKERSGY